MCHRETIHLRTYLVDVTPSTGAMDEDARLLDAAAAAGDRGRFRRRRALGLGVAVAASLGVVAFGAGEDGTRTWRRAGATATATAMPTIVVLGDASEGEDLERARASMAYAERAMVMDGTSAERARTRVRFSAGVFPSRWPDTLSLASSYANYYRDGKCCDDESVESRYPFDDILKSEKINRCAPGHRCGDPTLTHHLGCFTSHLGAFEEGLRTEGDKFVIWESDAPHMASVHVADYDELARRLPADADMVWMQVHQNAPGPFVGKFPSEASGKWTAEMRNEQLEAHNASSSVYLYRFNKQTGWAGSSNIMWTRKGLLKVREYIKEKGGDMIDAWLYMGCMKRCETHDCMNLVCYDAQTRAIPKEWLGGFVPDWYEQDGVDRAVDPEMYLPFDKEHLRYNQMGCERGGADFQQHGAFFPVGLEADGEVFEDTISNVLSYEGAMQALVNPCATALPLHPPHVDARTASVASLALRKKSTDGILFESTRVIAEDALIEALRDERSKSSEAR